jgi:mono/diheme cytochrome c family protein
VVEVVRTLNGERRKSHACGRRSAGFGLALVLVVGCTPAEDWPPAFPTSTYTLKQLGQGEETPFEPAPELRAKIDEFLVAQFGTPAEPKIKSATDERNFAIHKGSRLYRMHCMYCHGPAGAGDGASAAAYSPLPRDYRQGFFKWKSTASSQRPLKEDLVRTITHGIPGTSMPAFGRLAEEQRHQLAEYVTFLSQRGETEFSLLRLAAGAPKEPDELKDYMEEFEDELKDSAKKAARSWESAKPVPTPPRDESIDTDERLREASLQRGKQLFMGPKANCIKCHGTDGKGRPQVLPNVVVTDDKDVWGRTVSPRDLTEGVYRGGRRLEDTFLRIHEGIYASGMPAFGKDLNPDQVWDLVRFIRALPYRPDLLPGSRFEPKPPPGYSATP